MDSNLSKELFSYNQFIRWSILFSSLKKPLSPSLEKSYQGKFFI